MPDVILKKSTTTNQSKIVQRNEKNQSTIPPSTFKQATEPASAPSLDLGNNPELAKLISDTIANYQKNKN